MPRKRSSKVSRSRRRSVSRSRRSKRSSHRRRSKRSISRRRSVSRSRRSKRSISRRQSQKKGGSVLVGLAAFGAGAGAGAGGYWLYDNKIKPALEKKKAEREFSQMGGNRRRRCGSN